MRTCLKIFNCLSRFAIFCFLIINISQAAYLGEQKGGDTGTGGENGGGGTNVNDGGRGNGKGNSAWETGRGGHADDPKKNSNNKPPPPPPEPPVLNVHYDGPINPYMAGHLIFEAERVQEGKVVEHVDIKTEDLLKETVVKESENQIADAFDNGTEAIDADRRDNHLKTGLQKDTADLKGLVENAKNQARDNEQKDALERLAKIIGKYNEFQKDYGIRLEDKASELSGKADNTVKTAEVQKGNSQNSPANLAAAPTFETGAIQTLKNISKSIFNLLMGGQADNAVGNAFRRYFNELANKTPRRGAHYVKKALQNSGLNGGHPVVNSIGPVREKLMISTKNYLAPAVKIQYSQNRDKRNGPLSFDCSGFVSYIYGKAGLDMAKSNGGAPTVKDIIAKNGLFHEVDIKDAKEGDLIVHLGERDNHVGIYSGKDEQGNIKETSATTRKKAALRSIDDPYFKSSITEHPPSYIGSNWHIYQWNK